ncbi:uncharacterized protein LOC6050582 [Culex quinquefasciatus]|uniref:uncharacterized protein LOC119766630 n=1 Tax=Culex quinquefasciatus TaxID=7176 RepID=UPI0018E37E26|nr:uncharacterized protein LOC119766630 [Culex quinquefasciatus]XP_038107589.1 uncharacterized protein LOC119766630 [Culex quinquefasciatus]XP_038121210.1 uncharacterized protein LOC6050582 [Culex quinquefasciatus]XP_038121211.1 uncharacterized protein LOC6050582 [Culex quinquefasciatus]
MGRNRFAIEVAVGVLLSAGGWGTYLMKLATNVFQSDPAVHVWSRVASVEPTEAATLFRTHTPQTHIVSYSGGHQFDDQFVGDPRLSSHPCTTLSSTKILPGEHQSKPEAAVKENQGILRRICDPKF